MSSISTDLGFVQKFGLKYFAFLINLVIYIGVFELTKSMELFLIAAIFIPRIGSFLPNDDVYKQKNANEYNKSWYHMLAPVGSVLQLFVILYYTWTNYEEFNHSYQSLVSAWLGLGVALSQSIDACHQLIHRNEVILKSTGFIGLIPLQFTTYPIQHLYMHHKHVGSPQDDITAPKNTNFYVYYVRSIFSTYRQTFKYSKSFFAFCLVLHLGYVFSLYQFALTEFNGNEDLAFRKTGFFFLVAFAALFVMESIEYIEHYGLIYRRNNEQKPVLEISSWNTTVNPVYNWSIFRFQRHSDHHMNAYKTYSSLQLNEKMPLLPFSFPEAIAASWFPQIWYNIADHLVDKVINHEKMTKEDIKRSRNWMRVSNILTVIILVTNSYIAYHFNHHNHHQTSIVA